MMRARMNIVARSPQELERLASELAALSAEERAKVIAQANRRTKWRPPPPDWEPPVLSGGSEWIGGSLSREEIYGDDGR